MIETIQLGDIAEYGVVAVILLLWIQSLRFRLTKREEACQRITDDYINYLKQDRHDSNTDRLIANRSLSDTQRIPTMSDINASAD